MFTRLIMITKIVPAYFSKKIMDKSNRENENKMLTLAINANQIRQRVAFVQIH